MQRLHHQHEGLKAHYEPVRKYYEAEAPPPDEGPRSLELEVAEQTDIAVNHLEDLAEDLLKTARLTDIWIRDKWRAKKKEEQKERRS